MFGTLKSVCKSAGILAGIAMLALAPPLPASAQTEPEAFAIENWEQLVTQTFDMDTRGFLIDQSVNYIVFLQNDDRDNWAMGGSSEPSWSPERIRTEVERYFALVEQPVLTGNYRSVANNISAADVRLLQQSIMTDNEVAAFACVIALPLDDAGNMQWGNCETDFDVTFAPTVKAAAVRFLNAFNSGISSRIVNDGFGGSTCHVVDRLVEAHTTETFTLELDVNIGLGSGNSRPCDALKPRWAALAGYERLMATEEFGE